jgi:hypothetical protein
MAGGQPPAGQAYEQTQMAGPPAWGQPGQAQPGWGQPNWGQQGQPNWGQQGQDQPTQAYSPGPGGPSQPAPGQYAPADQYSPQYTPPGQYPAPGQWPQQPGSGGSGRSRTAILSSAAAVIVLAAGAGAYALVSSLHHSTTSSTPPSGPPVIATTSSQPTTPTTPAQSSPSSTPASSSSGPASTVALSQAAASSPAATQVQTLFGNYFDGINTRNYAEYSATMDATMQQSNGQSKFDSGYATTTDSNEVINSITDNGGGNLTASVSFTSTQDPKDSVDGASCNTWTLNLPLVQQGSGYLITTPPSGYATYGNC